jgi:hypothetical protein
MKIFIIEILEIQWKGPQAGKGYYLTIWNLIFRKLLKTTQHALAPDDSTGGEKSRRQLRFPRKTAEEKGI